MVSVLYYRRHLEVSYSEMREIPGHSGYYITESGVVYSNHGRGANGELRELKQQTWKGYKKVMFRDKKRYSVHRLVCLTYLPNPDALPQVNHKDEDKSNNNLTNLEWCDNTYNLRYSRARDWRVRYPDGSTHTIHNITLWCKENNVSQGNLCSRGKTKGYSLV